MPIFVDGAMSPLGLTRARGKVFANGVRGGGFAYVGGVGAGGGGGGSELPEGWLADLGALPTALSTTLVWPTLPTTGAPVVVADLATLNAALMVPGSHVVIDTPIVGTATVNADDIEISGIGSVDTLVISQNRHRVRVGGISIGQVSFSIPAYFDDELGQVVYEESRFATDIVFDDVSVNAIAENAFTIYARRLAILHSTVVANWYSVYVGTAATFPSEDIIVHDCNLSSAGPEATIRLHQVTRSVVTENVISNTSKHNWRLHTGSTLAFCGRNQLVGTGIMLTDPFEPSDTAGSFWFEDNHVQYTAASGVIITTDPYTRIDSGSITGNIFQMAGATTFEDIWSYGAVPSDWDLSGNTIVAP